VAITHGRSSLPALALDDPQVAATLPLLAAELNVHRASEENRYDATTSCRKQACREQRNAPKGGAGVGKQNHHDRSSTHNKTSHLIDRPRTEDDDVIVAGLMGLLTMT